MAVINRFNKFTPRDYNMEWYAPETFVPNFEAWDSMFNAQQTRYDTAVAATQKLPKHLQNRVDLAGEYKKSTSDSVDAITQEYLKNGITAGNRSMRDFGLKLNKQWQPGGLAYELEQEYGDYQTAKSEIDKFYKDAKAEHSMNKKFSLSQLQKAAQGEFKYDADSDIYTRASIAADTRPYIDIMDEAQKVVKEIKENGYTDIVTMSPAWFKKIQVEEITPETIKEVTSTLLQQPKYAEQRQLELWGEKQKYTPEGLTQLETDYKTKAAETFDETVKNLETLQTTDKGKKQLQTVLESEGYYTGKINGKFDKETKEAYDKYIADAKEKLNGTLEKTNADSILSDQLLSNYTRPLVAAYKRKKEEESLIFNQEWGINAKIVASNKNTADMITAMQKLHAPETGDYLMTPGGSRPMESLDKLKTEYSATLDQSKAAFNNIAKVSGITGILGSTAPNVINAATEARLRSSTPEEFQANLLASGIVADSGKLWDYYNSPGAASLKNSYVSMQQAADNLEATNEAQTNTVVDYFKTSNGKQKLKSIRSEYGLTGTDEEIAKMVVNNDAKLKAPITTYADPIERRAAAVNGGSGTAVSYRNVASDIRGEINKEAQVNPNAFPLALRGYSFNAIKGAGSELEKNIVDDLSNGYTLGYNGIDGAGVNFTNMKGGSKVALEDVDMATQNMRFTVDAKGITYYISAKTRDGKNQVSTVLEAPETHYNNLMRIALDMKKQAYETGDSEKSALAEQMYSVLTTGPQYQNAVQDNYRINESNGKPLKGVIDRNKTKSSGKLTTFENNKNVIGKQMGMEIEANGLVYQKFKIFDRNTNENVYMMTKKTDKGYDPIPNKKGGYYFRTAREAESPVIDGEMMRQIPVEINQQKIKQTNISPEDAALMMQGNKQINDNLQDDDNNDQ